MILEYKQDITLGGVKVTPPWIECGGFMPNPSNFTFVGFSPSVREYKIPDSAVTLSVQQCKDRLLSIHALTPIKDIDDVDMTDSEVEALAVAIISENDIA